MNNLIFETPHVWGRLLLPEDEEALLAVYGDAESMRWVGDGEPLDRAQCAEWIAVTQKNYETRGYGMFALVLRGTNSVVGFSGLVHPGGQPEPEIKYALLPQFRGQGLATEAARALLSYGFQKFGLTRIIATAYAGNAASHRVLQKAGMEVVGFQNEPGGIVNVYVWQPDRTKQEEKDG